MCCDGFLARCSDVSERKLDRKLCATAKHFCKTEGGRSRAYGRLSEYYDSQRGGRGWHISTTQCFYRTICCAVVVNMSDNTHTATDSQGFWADSSDPSLVLFFSLARTEAFGKAFRGVYAGDLFPLIRRVSGWIQRLLEEGGGGACEALNPPFSLYSGLFSTFSSLPLRLLPFIFGNISFSWVKPVTVAEHSCFLPIVPLATERKMEIEFSLRSKAEGWARVQTSPPSRSICGAKSAIWCRHIPGIHLDLKRGGDGTVDHPGVDWTPLLLHFFLVNPSF